MVESGSGATREDNGCKELVQLLVDCEGENTDIINIRDDSNKASFFFFARELLPCVTKKLTFRQNKYLKRLSEFVTVSDEAFALFTLENNAACWNAMFEKNITKSDNSTPIQKFHNNAGRKECDNNGGRVKRSAGGKDGYGIRAAERYNEYYRYVRDCRQDETKTFLLEQSFIKFLDGLDGSDKYKRLSGNKRLRNGELNFVDDKGEALTILCDL
jgi:hypothetical protein